MLTGPLVSTSWPAMTMATNPSASAIMPMTNLAGVDGSRWARARRSHRYEKTGPSVMMNSGLADWNHDDGTLQFIHGTARMVDCSANSVSELPACSNADQKMMLPNRASTTMTP